MRNIITWLKTKFTKIELKPNPYIGKFRGWNSTTHQVYSPDETYCFWIHNGLSAFEDSNIGRRDRPKAFLSLLSDADKKLVWEAVKHDLLEDFKERGKPIFPPNRVIKEGD